MSILPVRTVKSYVLRQSRFSERQREDFHQLWEEFGCVFSNKPVELSSLFGNTHPCIMEIGFGDGASLAVQAESQPSINFLGIEVHKPGIAQLLRAAKTLGLKNIKVICADAMQVIEQGIRPESLQGIQVFFPDPWPKRKHHKRRLIQKHFVLRMIEKIKTQGFIHCATDWAPYATQMMEVLSGFNCLENTAGERCFSENLRTHRDKTQFEQKGINLSHDIYDLFFKKRR